MRAFEVAYITGVESKVIEFFIGSETWNVSPSFRLGPTFFDLKLFRCSVLVATIGLAQIREFKIR